MPVTPYHLGPVLLLGILIFPALYLPGLLIGSVIVDIEPFLYLSHGIGTHPHAITHTYLGGAVVGIALGLVLFSLRKLIRKIMRLFRLGQDSSLRNIIASSVLGVYSHIFFDSFMYGDIEPFFPLKAKPLYEMLGWGEIYIFSGVAFILGFFVYLYKLSKKNGLRRLHRKGV